MRREINARRTCQNIPPAQVKAIHCLSRSALLRHHPYLPSNQRKIKHERSLRKEGACLKGVSLGRLKNLAQPSGDYYHTERAGFRQFSAVYFQSGLASFV